jgi:hypothetical protein
LVLFSTWWLNKYFFRIDDSYPPELFDFRPEKLNLDKENSLKTYLRTVCDILQVDIEKEVYATNLYKCFFKIPPADDQTILTRQFKIWIDLLINELSVFKRLLGLYRQDKIG